MFSNDRLKSASIVFLLGSSFALVIAYVLEYFFHMLPCKLCIYERIVYCMAGVLSAFCLMKSNKVLICLIFFIYLIGAIISFYHMGLEFHWFHDVLGCAEQIKGNPTVEELKNNLLNPNALPSCDKPRYLLGLSLAAWNLIYTLLCMLLACTQLIIKKRN
ncbi:disulfide bond formation protein B [Wolbachia endosymbiont of Pentidionis agamae]|uniref:disulfide bond formation protein B n=1 Tax=Wolbachia endosymbiont of Pentidionis agamae TaxID=3110435 RepID=UPI002FD309FE